MSERVVIAGGGVGALEALLALQELAPGRLDISVITTSRYLTYRALSVAEPFGADPAPRYDWELIARDRGVRWIPDTLLAVDAGARLLETRDGPPIRYDALALALGARPERALPAAIRFAGPADVLAIQEALEGLRPGRRHAIAFVVPAGVTWTLPLYELALMTSRYGREHDLDLQIDVVTRERAPLDIFGAAASEQVARRLAADGIRIRAGTFAQEHDEGKLWLELEGPLEVDLVIALAPLRGPAVPGLPAAPHGFVAVDPYGRVRGVERVWAVGDMTTRPLKQGGLAAQQADVAAADIAASVAGVDVEVRPYEPRLEGMLLTGDEPLRLERRPAVPQASSGLLARPAYKVAGRYLGPYLESLAERPTS